MKNILITIISFMLCFLLACTKKKETSIVGLWNLSNLTLNYYSNNTLDSTKTQASSASFNFKADNSVIIINAGDVKNGTYELNSSKTILTVNNSNFSDVYNVNSFTENELILSSKSGSGAVTIDNVYKYVR